MDETSGFRLKYELLASPTTESAEENLHPRAPGESQSYWRNAFGLC